MGVWGAQQWVRLTPETVFGTYNSSNTPIWIRLVEGASFALDAAPNPFVIKSADGGNLRQQRGNRRIRLAGSMRTPVYPSQAVVLLGSIFTPAIVGGRKQVPSWTADWFDSVETRRAVGMRFLGQSELTFDNTRDYGMLNAAIRAQQPGVAPSPFIEPASTVFPTEIPYCFQDSSGLVALGGTLVGYKSLSIRVNNMFKENFNESQYVQNLDYVGREADATVVLEHTSSTMRTNFENQVALAGSLGFNVATPAHSMTFNLQGNVYIGNRTVDRSFDDNVYQTLTLEAFKDPVTGLDLVFSGT
jgi:hypothetical protein